MHKPTLFPSRGPTSSPCICSLHPNMTVFGQNCELLSLVWYYHYLNVTSIPSYWMTGLLLIYTVHTRNLPFCGWLVNLKEQQCYGTALHVLMHTTVIIWCYDSCQSQCCIYLSLRFIFYFFSAVGDYIFVVDRGQWYLFLLSPWFVTPLCLMNFILKPFLAPSSVFFAWHLKYVTFISSFI